MNIAVIFPAAAFAAGVTLGIGYRVSVIRYLRRRVRELRSALNEGREPVKPETMKRVVWACTLNGFAWVWCSYILAALDKPQIAEELSKVALVEIIAPVFAYAAKSAVENLSKNNRWPDKGEPTANPPEDGEASGMG